MERDEMGKERKILPPDIRQRTVADEIDTKEEDCYVHQKQCEGGEKKLKLDGGRRSRPATQEKGGKRGTNKTPLGGDVGQEYRNI